MTDEHTSENGECCGSERELIQAARRQAEEARQPGDLTATSPAGSSDVDPTAPPPDSFTGYEIVREIHRGGQGVVYRAIHKGTKRKVAIKVMHEGPFASPRDTARFEREVQILGQLNHPHIVAIHDSGSATSGNFYYVMDYIPGHPLDVYMAGRDHSVEETLGLFAKICDAVNAAHLHGVIHRDLKPGNIRIDPDGEPHILDFGLAKTMLGETTDESRPQIMTMTGQFIGSLPWASPEQAGGISSKIDIRTDVYSLGVILYQMLTGRFPYEVVGNMRDVLDNILKTEPAKPSTVRRRINNEVETIVLSALAKEPERRYQSAGNFAEDVRRFLLGEPIRAKGDSALYVLRKRLRPYATRIAVGTLLVVIVVGLGTVISSQWEQNRLLAERERIARVKDDAAQARRLYHEAFELCSQRSLDRALQKIEESVALDDSKVDARILKARITGLAGHTAEAIEELERAADDFPEVGAPRAYLAALLHEENPDAAAKHLQQSQQLGPAGARDYCLRAMTAEDVRERINLLSEAINLEPGRLSALLMRSACFFETREFDKMLTDALRARSAHPNNPFAAYNAGVACTALGSLNEAMREYRRAVELDDGFFKAWFNLAWVSQQTGDLPAARRAYRKAADLEPKNVRPLANLADLCETQGDLEQSLILYRRLAELDEKDELWPMYAGDIARQLGKWADAIAESEKAVRMNEDNPEANHQLAWTYLAAPESSGRNAERGLEIALELQGLSPPQPNLDATLALGYFRNGDLASATRAVNRRIEAGEGSATDYLVLGMCQAVLEQREAAMESHERAVKLMRSPDASADAAVLKSLREELEDLLQDEQD